MIEAGATLEVPRGTDYRTDAEKNIWSNVKWRALFCLLETRGHLPISTLAKAVGLDARECLRALESMEILAMIKKTEGGYVQTQNSFTRTARSQQVRSDIVADFILSNDQVTNRLIETASSERHQTRSVIYNSNQALIKKLYDKIDKAIEEFKLESDTAQNSWDGVYALSAALIDLTEGSK